MRIKEKVLKYESERRGEGGTVEEQMKVKSPGTIERHFIGVGGGGERESLC
jgi:hypothetical protein